ncbi:MAG: NUDIX hydrolase [Gemmatimonadota bacterium]|nr:NUDIX hydrolase [Gemmatimonadota bacterium]
MKRQRARRETSAGGVVVRRLDGAVRYLLIHDGHRNWGFPKGHVDAGESPADAARREVGEETGLGELVLHEPLGCIDWYFRHRGRVIHKYCHFFLFTSPGGDPTPQADEGIVACVWLDFEAATRRLSHANSRRILAAARDSVVNGTADRETPEPA